MPPTDRLPLVIRAEVTALEHRLEQVLDRLRCRLTGETNPIEAAPLRAEQRRLQRILDVLREK